MSLFPVPDWQLNNGNYPAVFLIDQSWSKINEVNYEIRSLVTHEMTGITPLHTPQEIDRHGEKMLHVIKSIARGLPDEKVTLVSVDRDNFFKDSTHIQHQSNLPEALMSIMPSINAGDLVVINVGPNGGQDSFFGDTLINSLLINIVSLMEGIVVISVGNKLDQLSRTQSINTNIVLVGAITENGTAASRFGSLVTCYGITPYDLPDLPESYTKPVRFGQSSAATAYIGGMVLMMLNYASSRALTLTSKQVVGLLQAHSQTVQVRSGAGAIVAEGQLPDWNRLRDGINLIG